MRAVLVCHLTLKPACSSPVVATMLLAVVVMAVRSEAHREWCTGVDVTHTDAVQR